MTTTSPVSSPCCKSFATLSHHSSHPYQHHKSLLTEPSLLDLDSTIARPASSTTGSTRFLPGLTLPKSADADRDDYTCPSPSATSDTSKVSTLNSYSSFSSLSPTSSFSKARYPLIPAVKTEVAGEVRMAAEAKEIIVVQRRDCNDGEEESLSRARRALWSDEPLSPLLVTPRSLAVPDPETQTLSPEDDDEDDDGWEDEVEERRGSIPCHHTLSLSPLASCLRSPHRSAPVSPRPSVRTLAPSSSSSPSASSSSSSSLSSSFVSFNLAINEVVPTYSKGEYERKGDEPVMKLSMRELVELSEVRRMIGLFSGKLSHEEGLDT